MSRISRLVVPRLAAVALFAAGLAGCNTVDRLANIGAEPSLSPIENPAKGQPRINMPMPNPAPVETQANSLWQGGARAFFKDQRASQVGDILTVTINIADTAQLANSSVRTRNNAEGAAAGSFFGLESQLSKIFPEAVDPASLVNLSSNPANTGTGSIARSENIALRVAAVVTDVLPNGNLVIRGSQEVRVNFETRVLQMSGVIRPQDIQSNNQLPYDRIAEARIAYGGRGQMTDFQQPRWGQQLYDIIFPF
jgi:flagellar L-ring protein precursor FlgH